MIDDKLKFALEKGIIDIEFINSMYEMNMREEILKKHPYAIWQGANGFWYTNIIEDGKKKKLKRKDKKSLEDYLLSIYQTNNPFCDCWDRWVERQKLCGRSDNTIYKYQTDYKRFIEGTSFEKLEIDKITDEDIARLISDNLREKQVSYKALQSLYGYIKAVMEKAIRDKLISVNPCMYIDLPIYKSKCKAKIYHTEKERTLSDDEQQILLDKLIAKEQKKPYYMPQYAIRLSMLTGMRVGEIAGLKWEDIFWNEGYILIRHSEKYNKITKEYVVEDTKNHKERIFPLTQDIENLLKTIMKRETDMKWLCEYVFANENGRINKSTISNAMRNSTQYDKRFSSVKSIHSNRRTLNSKMRCNGVSAITASNLLGNTVRCNDEHYTYDLACLKEKTKIVEMAGV